MRLLVVVPTYNEADNIARLLARIREAWPALDVLVVDDRSPDGTGELVRRHAGADSQVRLLERETKLGLGSAYRAGFAWGISRGYDGLIQIDADFSHDPQALGALAAGLEDHDLVVGSRYVHGGSVREWNLWRRSLSRSANAFARVVLGVPLRDLTGGFNAWRASALGRIGHADTSARGYSFQIEMKYRACLAGLRWVETPIVFADRRHGASKIPRSEVLTTFWNVLRWRLAAPRLPAA